MTYLGNKVRMAVGNVHVQIGFSVERLATDATSPKVDPIVKLGQLLRLERIVGEMERTLIRHLDLEFFEYRPPHRLKHSTDNKRAFSGAVPLSQWTEQSWEKRRTWHKDRNINGHNLFFLRKNEKLM